MSDGKLPGLDDLPAEVFKHGSNLLLSKLGHRIRDCWSQEKVPKEFQDTNIIHYTRKRRQI